MKCIMTMLVGILAIPAVFGAEADPEYIHSFEFDIKTETLQDVKKQVTQDTILKKYKIRLPILPPRLDRDQVKALVEKEIGARVEAAYPKTQFKQIEVDARVRFRKYNVNDSVTIRVLDPRTNQFRTIEDSIRRIDRRGILLGDAPHIYGDLDPKELPHFFKKRRDDAIMRYISGQTKMYEYQRSQEDKKLRKQLLPKIWIDEGYVWNSRKQKWVPREEVFNFLYERKLIATFQKAKPAHAERLLTTKGGLKFDDALNIWTIPGEENPATDPVSALDQATKNAARKADDSLKKWANTFDDIFTDKKEDVWDEGEKGDAVPEGKEAPKKDSKEDPTKAPAKEGGDEKKIK